MQGPQAYGSFAGPEPWDTYGTKIWQGKPKAVPNRKRWNAIPIVLGFLFPYAIFVGVLAANYFPINAQGPMDALVFRYFIIGFALFLVLCTGFVAFLHWFNLEWMQFGLRPRSDNSSREPTWWTFLFATGLVAWVAAFVLGELTSPALTGHLKDVMDLNFYQEVDVTAKSGLQLMDAGRINFVQGTHLALNKSMGFRHDKIYCVAPVAPGGSFPPAVYDFWAVGVGCCSDHAADFHCGPYADQTVKGGIRVTDKSTWQWYQYALQQAEATYGIRAENPLFLTWGDTDIVEHSQDDTTETFLESIYWYILFQGGLVLGFLGLLHVTGWSSGRA
jgi:hypothetical protein